MFEKCDIAQSRYFAAVYGEEHLKPRSNAIRGLANTHEDHHKVSPIDFIGDVWGRMNHRFIDACLEGVRRIIRISPPVPKRDKIAISALRPRADGAPLWQFPDTFAIESPTGFWQSIIAPELARKMESQMIASASGKTPPGLMAIKPELELAMENTRLRTICENVTTERTRSCSEKCTL